MKVYIISYLGPRAYTKIRESRKKTHKEQVQFFIDRGHSPIILNQDYDLVDFLDGVEYVGDNSLHTASEARNILLDIHYNSDELFACFADNDTVYKDIFSYDPLAKITENEESLKGKVDLLFSLNPITFPFHRDIKENQETYNTRFCFRKTDIFKESLFVQANTQKIYGSKYYFEVDKFKDTDGNMIPGEGTDYVFNLLSNSRVALQLRQLILHEKDSKSTWNPEKDQERYRVPNYIKQHWIDKHNIPVNDLNSKKYLYIAYTVDHKGEVSYKNLASHADGKKFKNETKYADKYLRMLPVAMVNADIAAYLEYADVNETMKLYPKNKLLKEMSVRRELAVLYKHVDFSVIDSIMFK